MNKRIERTAFKKLLKCQPACYKANGTAADNKVYVSKGDVLDSSKYRNLPPELHGMIYNPPEVYEFGAPAVLLNTTSEPH